MPIFGRRWEQGRSAAGKLLSRSFAASSSGRAASSSAGSLDGEYGRLPSWVPPIWDLYDNVGEVHNASNFLAKAFSRCVLRLGAISDTDGTIGPAFRGNGEPIEGVDANLAGVAARAIRSLRCLPMPGTRGPVGGQGMFLKRIGANYGTVGDVFVMGWNAARGRYRWEVISTEEARPMPMETKIIDGVEVTRQPFRRYRSRSGSAYEVIYPDLVIPVYDPHPRFSGEPDAANRALMKTAERLRLLTDEGLAESMSRLASPGMLLIPSEIDWPDGEDGDDGDFVTKTLMAVGEASIRDPSSPSRFLPVAFEVPGERAKEFTLLKFGNDGSIVAAKREAAVGDYARGSPFPPEVTTGFGASSLANAFVITEEISRLHVEPPLDVVTGCLTGGYLTPLLMVYEGLDPLDIPPPRIEKLVIWYDLSRLVSHTNPEKVVAAGYGTVANPNFLISGDYARSLNGVPQGAAPTPQEIEQRLAWAHQVRMRSEVGGHKDNTTDTPEAPDDGMPQNGPDQEKEVGKRSLALADYVVQRAKERAGAWLRSKAQAKEELAARIKGVDNAEVARVLGPAVVSNLGNLAAMLAGEWTTFERTVRENFAHRSDVDEITAAALALVRKDFALRLFTTGARQNARLAAEFMELLDA